MYPTDVGHFMASVSFLVLCIVAGCGKTDMEDDLEKPDVETMTLEQAERSLYDDVAIGDVERVAQILDKYEDLTDVGGGETNSWMDHAAYYGQFEVMEFLRTKGFTYIVTVGVCHNSDDEVTIFTAGLSSRPMQVPRGGEPFRFAELKMRLPANWVYQNSQVPGTFIPS